MQIFDKNGVLILTVDVDDSSTRTRAIMGDHNIVLNYSLSAHVELPVGAYCDFDGERYYLLRPENLKMKHTRCFEYTVTMSSEIGKAKMWKFRNTVDHRLKFPLTAKPVEHLQMFVDNMNRHDTGWSVGDCIDDVEKLISYDHCFCSDALAQMASTFETEYEIVGKSVSLHKVEYNKSEPLELSYGKGNGFKSGVGRNSNESLPVEVLFVQGGERNIDRSKYPDPDNETLRSTSNGCLLLPVGQTISYDGEHFEDEDGYNATNARQYIVDDLGLSIHNTGKDLTSGAEDSLDRSDDYPKRVGTVSKAVAVDTERNFYDIVDEDIPNDLNYQDCLIKGEQMTIIFQSGMLAGREFDVKYIHEATTVNGVAKDARRFEIVPQEIDGIMMPGENFVPKKGDTYAIFNVMLPDSYIRNDATKSGGSWDMFRAAVKYMYDNEEQKFSFSGELDGLWAKQNWENIGGKIRLGGFVKFTSPQIAAEGIIVRITSIKENLNNLRSPKIELSNDAVSPSFGTTLKILESTEVEIDEDQRTLLQFTKRRFRDAVETAQMLAQLNLDNFTSGISPISMQTMSALIGDESLQFRFVEIATTTDENGSEQTIYTIIREPVWYSENRLHTKSGMSLQHHTIGNKVLTATERPSEQLRTWQMASFESPNLAVEELRSKGYFLYAKCSRTEATGEFVLSDKAIGMEQVEGSYHFLVGVLTTLHDGERSYSSLYGYTEILPGRMTTDLIRSNDGKTYFDLVNGEIGGIIKFLSENNTYETLIEGGKIKTQWLDVGDITAKRLEVINDKGQGVKIVPDETGIGTVGIYDENGKLVSIFEGNTYSSVNELYGDQFGTVEPKPRPALGTSFGYGSGTPYSRGKFALTSASNKNSEIGEQDLIVSKDFFTTAPVEMILHGGSLHCFAHAAAVHTTGGSTGGGVIELSDDRTIDTQDFEVNPGLEIDSGLVFDPAITTTNARISATLSVVTYPDEAMEQAPIDTQILATCEASAAVGIPATIDGTIPEIIPAKSDTKRKNPSEIHKILPAGHHVLVLHFSYNVRGKTSAVEFNWGFTDAQQSPDDIAAEYKADYYVSRYFANGLCLGIRQNQYVMIWKDDVGMNFAIETNGFGFKVLTDEGIKYRPTQNGSWKKLT